MSLILYVGNHNYSSWSMRAGVLMRAFAPDFTEKLLHFDGFDAASNFKREAGKIAPTATVPILVDTDEIDATGGPLAVWDTLAIAEYVADIRPDAPVWPRQRAVRARARSLCAEMHAGFQALRGNCLMNIGPDLSRVGALIWRDQPTVRANVARLEAAWADILKLSGGPFLGGEFGAIDAYFAPIVMRLHYYGLPVSPATRSYMDQIFAHPAVNDWIKTALSTAVFIDFEEPYRLSATDHI